MFTPFLDLNIPNASFGRVHHFLIYGLFNNRPQLSPVAQACILFTDPLSAFIPILFKNLTPQKHRINNPIFFEAALPLSSQEKLSY